MGPKPLLMCSKGYSRGEYWDGWQGVQRARTSSLPSEQRPGVSFAFLGLFSLRMVGEPTGLNNEHGECSLPASCVEMGQSLFGSSVLILGN